MAGVEGEGRVDDKLESAADERGVGIGVGRNGNERDESGTGLVSGELLLSLGDGRVFGIGGFVEEIGSRIAERHAVGGVVVNGKCGIARRVLGDGRRGGLGFSGGLLSGRGVGMATVAAGKPRRAENEKKRDGSPQVEHGSASRAEC